MPRPTSFYRSPATFTRYTYHRDGCSGLKALPFRLQSSQVKSCLYSLAYFPCFSSLLSQQLTIRSWRSHTITAAKAVATQPQLRGGSWVAAKRGIRNNLWQAAIVTKQYVAPWNNPGQDDMAWHGHRTVIMVVSGMQ